MNNRYKHHVCCHRKCRRLRLWQDYRNAEYGSDVVSVLYSRANMWLVPDEDAPQCCPCPDHATNYVSVSYVSGRLSLLDEDGARFSRATKSCKVHVGGVSPSKGIGDARLMFSNNGRTCRDTRYTVFGVGISSAANVIRPTIHTGRYTDVVANRAARWGQRALPLSHILPEFQR